MDRLHNLHCQLYNAALEERYEKWLTEELRKQHAVEFRQ